MFWIAIAFILIMVSDWRYLQNKQVKLKQRWVTIGISVCFFVLSEILYLVKDKWNLAIFAAAVRKTVQMWM
ncbi:hypothetical protein P4H39_30515 [Paenibacillus lautus]|uniref:hypothetical protein n=1 Tax=Paenibacillus lautus TaxID=1401 RepID=UPI002DBEB322|nr:hypothetical protein [Paenibacillus lautus]MEC0206950.1 hypothetical protein [Paenibacillus lautus]